MEQKEFDSLNADDKLSALFAQFTNHLSEHKTYEEIIERNFEKVENSFQGIVSILSDHKAILDDLYERMPNRPFDDKQI
ncbi:hypothetical protein ACFL6I_02605 [candidate division KSB1 bacterium]